jgi:hypothetical protein
MIFIGNHFHGPELTGSPIDRLLTSAAKAAVSSRGPFDLGSTPAVNVVFHVPGSLGEAPQAAHPVAGRFSRKQKLLLVEVYVPKEQVATGGSIDFVIDSLRQANAIAADVFARKGTEPFDVAKANAIIDQVSEALRKEP